MYHKKSLKTCLYLIYLILYRKLANKIKYRTNGFRIFPIMYTKDIIK